MGQIQFVSTKFQFCFDKIVVGNQGGVKLLFVNLIKLAFVILIKLKSS